VLDERRIGRLGLRAAIGVLACPGASNIGTILRDGAASVLQVSTASEGPVSRCSSLCLLKVDKSLKVRSSALAGLGCVTDVLYRGVAGTSVDSSGVAVGGIINGESESANASMRLRVGIKNFLVNGHSLSKQFRKKPYHKMKGFGDPKVIVAPRVGVTLGHQVYR